MLTPMLFLSAIAVLLLGNLAANAQSAGAESYEVKYGDQEFEIQAVMPGEGRIGSIQVFPEYGSIYLTLDVDPEAGDGELRIVLPRSLIDSKTEDATDMDFLVLVDGEDVEYSESSTSLARELRIPILADATEVEIFGSQVLPEFPFGIVPVIVSAITIFLIIYRRTNVFTKRSP
jgi:hypothetical protein